MIKYEKNTLVYIRSNEQNDILYMILYNLKTLGISQSRRMQIQFVRLTDLLVCACTLMVRHSDTTHAPY